MRLLLLAATMSCACAVHAQEISLSVDLYLLTEKNEPIAGAPVRIAFSGEDWRAANAGHRVVTDERGHAHFVAKVSVDSKWAPQNIGFTPFSKPIRTKHLLIAAELPRALKVDGVRHDFHWLYVENVEAYSTGQTSGGYINQVFARDDQGNFTVELEPRLSVLSLAARTSVEQRAIAGDDGYTPADFALNLDNADASGNSWTLSLAYKRMRTQAEIDAAFEATRTHAEP